MKKLFSAVMLAISAIALSVAAYADLAPIPPEPAVKDSTGDWIIPLVIVIVVIAAVILVRVFRSKKK